MQWKAFTFDLEADSSIPSELAHLLTPSSAFEIEYASFTRMTRSSSMTEPQHVPISPEGASSDESLMNDEAR